MHKASAFEMRERFVRALTERRLKREQTKGAATRTAPIMLQSLKHKHSLLKATPDSKAPKEGTDE
jgi:hypothetical protein